jgi:hypothetical protein
MPQTPRWDLPVKGSVFSNPSFEITHKRSHTLKLFHVHQQGYVVDLGINIELRRLTIPDGGPYKEVHCKVNRFHQIKMFCDQVSESSGFLPEPVL